MGAEIWDECEGARTKGMVEKGFGADDVDVGR